MRFILLANKENAVMSTDTNNQDGATDVKPDAGEGQPTEKFEVSKTEYDDLLKDRASLGSLKRELKDLKKSIDSAKESKDTPTEKTKSDDYGLLQKGYLRMGGISAEDEVELALSTAKKWGVEVDKLLDDPDFQVKLKRMRDDKANTTATTEIKGEQGGGQAKNTTAYWKAKGAPPTPDDVPDRKTRQKIVREMLATAGTKGTKYYNE